MKQKIIKRIGYFIAAISLICLQYACDDMNSLHEPYIKNGEIVYLVKPTDLKLRAGRKRLIFDFKIVNPNTEKYCLVTGANGKEVFKIDIQSNIDTFRIYKELNNLAEKSYTYYLQTFNDKGNTSLKETAFGNVYGDFYQSTLQNVAISSLAYDNSNLKVQLSGVSSTTQLGYELSYFSLLQNTQKTLSVNDVKKLQWEDDVTFYINEIVSPTHLLKWRTAYLPEKTAVDTFYTAWSEIQAPMVNAYIGSYHSTGTFKHPSSGTRTFDMDKTFVAIDENTCETDHSDLGSNGYKIRLKVNTDNTVAVSQYNGSGAEIGEMVPGTANTYNPTTKTFTLNYQYSGSGGYRVISETLVKK